MRKHVLVLTTTAAILTCGAIAASAQTPGTQPTPGGPMMQYQDDYHRGMMGGGMMGHGMMGQGYGPVDPSDDAPHHQLGGKLGIKNHGKHGVSGSPGSPGNDAGGDVEARQQAMERLCSHMRFGLLVELHL